MGKNPYEVTKKMMKENESNVQHSSTTNSRHERRKRVALQRELDEKYARQVSSDKRVIHNRDSRVVVANKGPLVKRVSRPTAFLKGNPSYRRENCFKQSHLEKKSEKGFKSTQDLKTTVVRKEIKEVEARNNEVKKVTGKGFLKKHTSKEFIEELDDETTESENEEVSRPGSKDKVYSEDSEQEGAVMLDISTPIATI
jgi:hypothetical protein